jgi:hypothetical protein
MDRRLRLLIVLLQKAYLSGQIGCEFAEFPPGLFHLRLMLLPRDLIIRGWISREHVAFAPSRRTRRKGTDANEMTETWNSARDILAFVECQEQDPVSVHITRTLRYIGYTEVEIVPFLRRCFGLNVGARAKKMAVSRESD